MRFHIVIVIFTCLLALCTGTRVGVSNFKKRFYFDMKYKNCNTVGSIFDVPRTQIYVKGYVTGFYKDSSCQVPAKLSFDTKGKWVTVNSPIQSYRVF
ncbi:hypothetical protein GGH94_000826 [Coemansia aciculifera]|uniref:Uncharacterized protein n=2 Tax=Coemansia TaxID=4863 RepID=A0A9W8GP96_9FUNG|nr:hypothetical protein GGI19_005594 [Coemansia pectinata]KAJ2867437.1 hypothetical protein GGH94_000826 [Coemansia aciculifera]